MLADEGHDLFADLGVDVAESPEDAPDDSRGADFDLEIVRLRRGMSMMSDSGRAAVRTAQTQGARGRWTRSDGRAGDLDGEVEFDRDDYGEAPVPSLRDRADRRGVPTTSFGHHGGGVARTDPDGADLDPVARDLRHGVLDLVKCDRFVHEGGATHAATK